MVLSHQPPISSLIEHVAERPQGSPNQLGPQLFGIHTQQFIKLELNFLTSRPESRLIGRCHARKVKEDILPKLIGLDKANVLGGDNHSDSTYAHRRRLRVGARSRKTYLHPESKLRRFPA